MLLYQLFARTRSVTRDTHRVVSRSILEVQLLLILLALILSKSTFLSAFLAYALIKKLAIFSYHRFYLRGCL